MIAGRYTLEAEIGRGGMGAVWRGRDELLGRTVALKKIGVAPGGISPDALRAEREAKLAAKLNHANVVAVFDLVEEESDGQSQQWLVMELVEGTDLAELIRRRGRLTPDEAAPILAQTASALAAAHSAGIVHRDVKPSNILVTPDGQVKLSDFGIARTSTDPALTQTGLVTGSPAYLSPEVASGLQATSASDAWSWGATLFHALEGRPPYQVSDNLLGALYRIVHEEPPRTPAAGWLAPALDATMTRDPAQRWPMATAERFLRGEHPQPAVASTGGLASIGLGDAARTRSHDDAAGTQLLPLSPRPTKPPPGALEQPRQGRSGRAWPAVAAATFLVLVVTGIAFAIGLHHHGADDPAGAGASSGPTTPSGSGSTSTKPSPTGAAPSAEAMVSFARDYVGTAVSDPAAAFELLTPAYQVESKGLDGYESFWGDVRSAKIEDISADPEAMEVTYRYRYVKPGGPTEQTVTLELSFTNGTYLIDGAR